MTGEPGRSGDESPRSYREAVDEAITELEVRRSRGPELLPEEMVDLVARSLDRPEARKVLGDVPGGPAQLFQQTLDELRAYRPNAVSNASNPETMAKIILLHQIDVTWWSDVAPFATDEDVWRSAELVRLDPLRAEGFLGFRYRNESETLPARARNYLRRRLAPRREPHTSGLSFAVARPAMVALLNEIAGSFAAEQLASGSTAPVPMWVTSTVRSERHQLHLRSLGYSALLPSSHCKGWAADIEMDWPERHGAADDLRSVLLRYRDDDRLNVIDEGQAWHVCLNPAHVDHYVAAYATARSAGQGR